MSYIFIIWKKNWKNLKEKAKKTANSKTTKNSAPYKLSAHFHHPPLQKSDLQQRPIPSKKSPQMPPNPIQGGLVYGNVTKVSF